jgi:hypothetical protein
VIAVFFAIVTISMITGCALNKFPAYNTPEWMNIYTGGTGDSTGNAVVINLTYNKKAVDAEYNYIAVVMQNAGNNCQPTLQAIYKSNNRWYDVIYVTMDNGDKREFHFDITKAHEDFVKRQNDMFLWNDY